MSVLGELKVILGVTADTFTVKDFSKAIGDVPFSVAGALTSLTSLSVGFLELTKNTLDISNTLGIFRSETGLSVTELQKWQAVATQVGMSGSVVQSAIMKITSAMAGLRTGHADMAFMQALGQLGVNPNGKSPFQVMEDIARAVKTKPAAISTDLITRAGFSPDMMRIFGMPDAERKRMMSVGPMMNEGDMRAMADFQQALGRFEITIEKSFVPALTAIEPYLADFARAATALVVILGGGVKETGMVFRDISRNEKQGMGLVPAATLGLMHENLLYQLMERAVSYNLTQNIHSTADPAEVARIAHENLQRHHTKASKHFNNGGY